MWEHLKIITLRAVFAAQKPGTLPRYLGSTVRGVLGHCMREFVCTAGDTKCFLCRKRQECLYVKYFSNTEGEGGAVNPYAIHVLKEGRTEWQEGDECVFDVTLFGMAAEAAGIYLDGILAMEKKGWGASRIPFRLIRITEPSSGRLIYVRGRTWIRNLVPHPMKIREQAAQTVMVSFDTPLRIVSGKELVKLPDFTNLIRFLSGRISAVSQNFTDNGIEWNEKMLKRAENITISGSDMRQVDFKRYSINQKGNRLELPAVKGWVLYEGDLSVFTPVLEAGTYLHVGKGATIGFGHYEVFYDR